MKKQILTTIISILFTIFVFGQTPNYNDVGVIINDNSQVSIDIGNYFQQARDIPEINMIHIRTVTDEEIDTVEFRKIQYQIKNYILQNNLNEKLYYLVTTKGLPFDIAVDSCTFSFPGATFQSCSSLESELTLLLSADSGRIFKKNSFQNPYYQSQIHQDENSTDLFLVSRLDGKTVQDVYNLIDNSGPGSYVNKELGQFIFDLSYIADSSSTFDYFANIMIPAIDTLTNRGWNTVFHGDTLVPENEDYVLGYVGFIQKSFHGALNFEWQKGAFCEFMVSSPDFTFYDSLNFEGNIQLADVIAEGCATGSGYVHPTFGSQLTDYAILFGRYTMERSDPYNLAESYYMATKTLSWMNILVGDPKTTITTLGSGSIESVSPIKSINLYPNPASETVKLGLNSESASIISISIFDQLGKMWQQEERIIMEGRNDLEIGIGQVSPGFYFLQVIDKSTNSTFTKKLMVAE